MSLSVVAAIAGAFALLHVVSLLRAVVALRYGLRVTVPTVAVVDVAWLDQRWVGGASATIDQLTELGFVLRCYLDGLSPRTAPTGMRCVAVLTNETTGELAQVAVVERPDDHGEIEMVTLPIFSLRSGSKRVATSNGDTPGVFVRPRAHAVHTFPMLYDVATLYRAHRAICEKHIGTRRGELPPVGSEVRQTNRDSAEEFAYQAKRGMLKAKPEGGYERTWRGAFYSVWKLHPRFIRGHKRRIHERGLRMLAEFDITPDPATEAPARREACEAEPLSPEMEAFIASACEEYNAATRRLQHEWHLDKATRFQADLTTGTLRFDFADGRAVLGDVQVLGSWSRKGQSWEWAWNNPNVDGAVKPDADRIREFGERSGVSYLRAGFVPAPTIEAAAYMAALGAKVVGATAVLPLPPDGDAAVVVYAALTNVRVVHSTAA